MRCACAGEAAAPLLFGPKAKVRAALEMSGIPYTYVVAYGFASYWTNGLGEVGPRDRVPPSPVNSSRQVPHYGNGRTKRAHTPSLFLPSASCLAQATCAWVEQHVSCLCQVCKSQQRLPPCLC